MDRAGRVLALELVQCQAKPGEPHANEYVSLAAVDKLTPKSAKALANGMENPVGVIGRLPGHEQDDDAVH